MSGEFETAMLQTVELTGGSTVFRRLGAGPPVLLLHGYPETNLCWHRLAPTLAQNFTVVAPDLPGYGDSRFAGPDAAFSKRSMASAMVELMALQGFDRFAVVGHDRGARVSYRMAFDAPDAVTSLTVIDIAPTAEEWASVNGPISIAMFHWPFLAQPRGLPEALLAGDPDRWIEYLFDSWCGYRDRIDDGCFADYQRCFRQSDVIAGTCADYRAGATIDWDHDRHDQELGNTIGCPVLALASGPRGDLGPTWRRWADDVTSATLDGGHFLPEENPSGVLDHLVPFLSDHRPR